MKRMFKSLYWRAFFVYAIIFAVAAKVTDNAPFTQTIRFIEIFLATAVSISFFREAWRSGLKEHPNAGDFLTLGIYVSWSGLATQGVWLQIWRMGGEPKWMVNSDVNALFLAWVCFGCSLHLLTTNAIDGQVPRSRNIMLGLVISSAVIIACIVFSAAPSLDSILDWLRPVLLLIDQNFVKAFSNVAWASEVRKPLETGFAFGWLG